MKKEFLNEENYQKSNKKVKIMALVIFLVGILLGGTLIVTGIVKMMNVGDSEPQNVRSEASIQAEIDVLNEDMIPLKAKKNEEFMKNGFSEDYYKIENELSTKQNKLMELETELSRIKSGALKIEQDATDFAKKAKYIPLIIIGGFISIASITISLFVFFISKRREIMAYTTQQVMPVAQEGIEKMAPTVGTVARELTKGIKEGLQNTEDNE